MPWRWKHIVDIAKHVSIYHTHPARESFHIRVHVTVVYKTYLVYILVSNIRYKSLQYQRNNIELFFIGFSLSRFSNLWNAPILCLLNLEKPAEYNSYQLLSGLVYVICGLDIAMKHERNLYIGMLTPYAYWIKYGNLAL